MGEHCAVPRSAPPASSRPFKCALPCALALAGRRAGAPMKQARVLKAGLAALRPAGERRPGAVRTARGGPVLLGPAKACVSYPNPNTNLPPLGRRRRTWPGRSKSCPRCWAWPRASRARWRRWRPRCTCSWARPPRPLPSARMSCTGGVCDAQTPESRLGAAPWLAHPVTTAREHTDGLRASAPDSWPLARPCAANVPRGPLSPLSLYCP